MKILLKMLMACSLSMTCMATFADAWIIPSQSCLSTALTRERSLAFTPGQVVTNLDKLAEKYRLIRIKSSEFKHIEHSYKAFQFGGRYIILKNTFGIRTSNFMLQRVAHDGDREDLIFDSKQEANAFYKALRNAYLVNEGNMCFSATSQPNEIGRKSNNIIDKFVLVGYRVADSNAPGKRLVRYYVLPTNSQAGDNADMYSAVFESD